VNLTSNLGSISGAWWSKHSSAASLLEGN